MLSVYCYSIALLICCLITQQIFYLRKKYSQQNTRILHDYLNIKLTSRLLEILIYKSEKNLMRSLIKKYYYLQDIIVYELDNQKFTLYDYESESLKFINENIYLLVNKLSELKPNQIYNIDNIGNLFGIYFFTKQTMIFLIKNEKTEISKNEIIFLESIILPIFVL